MKKKIIAVLGIALAFAMMMTGCGGVVPKLIDIAAADEFLVLEMDIGETTAVELVKTFTPEEITDEQIAEAMAAANLTWTSDNPDVVEIIIDDGGGGATFVAKTEGTATVDVSGGTDDTTLLVTFKVTVVDPIIPVETATTAEEMALTIKGEVFGSDELIVDVAPVDATNVEVSFASDDETIATVDENGTVTAVAVGETIIRTTVTCEADIDPIELETKVTVELAADAITLDATEGWIYVGGAHQLNPHTAPVEAPAHTYTFVSSDESVATISDTGLITGVKAGTATITVTSVEDPELTIDYNITVSVYVAPTPSSNSGRGTGSTGGSTGGGGSTSGGNTGGNGGGAAPTQPSTPAPSQPAPAEPAPAQPAPPAEPAPPPADIIGEHVDPGDGTHGGDAGGF